MTQDDGMHPDTEEQTLSTDAGVNESTEEREIPMAVDLAEDAESLVDLPDVEPPIYMDYLQAQSYLKDNPGGRVARDNWENKHAYVFVGDDGELKRGHASKPVIRDFVASEEDSVATDWVIMVLGDESHG